MPITREEPTSKRDDAPEIDDDDFFEPVTAAPKQTRRETFLQRKRERAGLGIMQVIGFGAGLLGKFGLAPVLPEDVAAVHYHARPIAKSLADAAAEDERFAAVFDRLAELGPYGAIIESVTALVMQIAVNHNKAVRNDPQLALQMGAVPPDVLLQTVVGEQSQNGDGPSE
jgi:hypothetical protein